jgi:hypothetical protein
MKQILIGLGVVALVSTVGDFVWYEYGVRHRAVVGVLHGAILLAAVGAVVGAPSGRLAAGIPVGALAGISGALVYYGIVTLGGRGSSAAAMVIAWAMVWMMLAMLDGRVLRSFAPRPWNQIMIRGVLAAALGGAAFYLMMDTLWGRPPAGGRNYFIQFFAWLVAWAPGLLALTAPGTRPEPMDVSS